MLPKQQITFYLWTHIQFPVSVCVYLYIYTSTSTCLSLSSLSPSLSLSLSQTTYICESSGSSHAVRVWAQSQRGGARHGNEEKGAGASIQAGVVPTPWVLQLLLSLLPEFCCSYLSLLLEFYWSCSFNFLCLNACVYIHLHLYLPLSLCLSLSLTHTHTTRTIHILETGNHRRVFNVYDNILKCMYSTRFSGGQTRSGVYPETESTPNVVIPLIHTLDTFVRISINGEKRRVTRRMIHNIFSI